jgi:hypothetical protein
MIVTKPGRQRRISDEACRRIVEWKRLSELCKELDVPRKTAERIRTKYRQVFQ